MEEEEGKQDTEVEVGLELLEVQGDSGAGAGEVVRRIEETETGVEVQEEKDMFEDSDPSVEPKSVMDQSKMAVVTDDCICNVQDLLKLI